jgi:hypothetical protein
VTKASEAVTRAITRILRTFTYTVATVCAIAGTVTLATRGHKACWPKRFVKAYQLKAAATSRRPGVIDIGFSLRNTCYWREGVQGIPVYRGDIPFCPETDSISFENGWSDVFSVTTPYYQGIVASHEAIGSVMVFLLPFIETVVSGNVDQCSVINPQFSQLAHDSA